MGQTDEFFDMLIMPFNILKNIFGSGSNAKNFDESNCSLKLQAQFLNKSCLCKNLNFLKLKDWRVM